VTNTPREVRPHPQRALGPSGLTHEPTSHEPHVEKAPEEEEATEPPPPRTSTRKLRRGEGQTPVPTTYLIPTALPRAPTPSIDTSPEQPLLSETIEGSANDDNWKEDLWDPIEGENKQQVEQ
jgi:hypothetical protein